MTTHPKARPVTPERPGLFHTLMERSPVPMAEFEGEGHIVRYANPAFSQLVGKSLDALIGSPFAGTVQEGDGCLAVLDRVYRTNEAETHTESEHPGSHPVYWSYAIWPVLDADERSIGLMMQVSETTRFHQQTGAMNEALVLSSVRQHELREAAETLNEKLEAEITYRKIIYDALRRSEAWQRLLLDHVEDFAIFSLSETGQVIDWNAGAGKIFGYSRDEIVGQSEAMLFTLEDQTAGIPTKEMATAAADGYANDERWHQRKNGEQFFASGTMRPLRDESGKHLGFVKVARDVTERKRHEERQELLLNELSHRVKNTLTTVQSIALQTMQSASTMADFQAAFESRLETLATTHNLLLRNSSQVATLRDLAASELLLHSGQDQSRYTLEGDDILLQSSRAVPIGMMFHELTTNAVKYGALSVPAGRIDVSWIVSQDGRRLHLEWVESGGPAVKKPSRRGFGSRLIERGLAHELGAVVHLIFDATGLRCAMDIPL